MTPTEKRLREALEIFSRAIPWLRGYAYTMRTATHGIPSETTLELESFIDLEFLPALAATPSLRERVVEECIARATGLLSQPDDAFHDPCHAWDSALACLITDLRALVKSPPVSGEKEEERWGE